MFLLIFTGLQDWRALAPQGLALTSALVRDACSTCLGSAPTRNHRSGAPSARPSLWLLPLVEAPPVLRCGASSPKRSSTLGNKSAAPGVAGAAEDGSSAAPGVLGAAEDGRSAGPGVCLASERGLALSCGVPWPCRNRSRAASSRAEAAAEPWAAHLCSAWDCNPSNASPAPADVPLALWPPLPRWHSRSDCSAPVTACLRTDPSSAHRPAAPWPGLAGCF